MLKKFALILGVGLVFSTSFSEISHAKTLNTNSQIINSNLTNPTNLADSDLSQIKQNIITILSQKYETMKTGKYQASDNIVNDSKLLELLNKTNSLNVQWYKDTNLKISDFNNSLNINNIQKLSDNNYLVDVNYSVEFALLPDNTKSSSSDEKYQFQLQKIDGVWYINKMLDLQEDINSTNNNLTSNKSLTNNANTSFNNYDSKISSKISSIDTISKNIDKYLQEYNNIKNIKTSNIQLTAASYSGYKANVAINYARKWANGRNPSYKDYGSNDCTNFVSQAVNWGGIPRSSTWTQYTNPWINVIGFYNYMRSAGYTYGGDSSSSSRLGDVIQLYNSGKGTWSHTVIITGRSGSGWLYSGHSNNRLDYPIAAVYPTSTYTNIRYIKYWY